MKGFIQIKDIKDQLIVINVSHIIMVEYNEKAGNTVIWISQTHGGGSRNTCHTKDSLNEVADKIEAALK